MTTLQGAAHTPVAHKREKNMKVGRIVILPTGF